MAKFTVSGVDTGGKFAEGSLKPVANLPPMSFIRIFTLTCKYLREFFEKIRSEPYFIFRSLPEAKNLVTPSLSITMHVDCSALLIIMFSLR